MQIDIGQQEVEAGGGQRTTIPPLAWPLIALIVAGVGYLALTRGSESKRIQFRGFSSSSSGTTLGGHTLFCVQGQTITVDYEVTELRRGSLKIRVLQERSLELPVVLARRTVSRKESGQIRIEAPATGFYEVECDGSPDGNGYDVTYKASWKVG